MMVICMIIMIVSMMMMTMGMNALVATVRIG